MINFAYNFVLYKNYKNNFFSQAENGQPTTANDPAVIFLPQQGK
jgi:hypothetical protein